MTGLELLALISRREERGLSTTRVTMSPEDASQLHKSLTGKLPPGEVKAGALATAFGVDIWVDEDGAGWTAEGQPIELERPSWVRRLWTRIRGGE